MKSFSLVRSVALFLSVFHEYPSYMLVAAACSRELNCILQLVPVLKLNCYV